MSKKKQRISYLVWIRNAINTPDLTEVTPNKRKDHVYSEKRIKQVLATLDDLLASDGVFPMSANSKVND